MKIAMTVELLDTGSTFDLEVRSPDFRAWEKATGLSWLEEPTSVTNISDLAYYAALRLGLYSGSLVEWGATADVDEIQEEVADPTQPGDGVKLSSPS
jgi:hypothetical protein